MNLNQYKISTNNFECVITAKTKQSAWLKFITQRFGSLKPNPKDYKVLFLKTVKV